MHPRVDEKLLTTRRHLLGGMAGGIGAIAMGDLLGAATVPAVSSPGAPPDPLAARLPPRPICSRARSR